MKKITLKSLTMKNFRGGNRTTEFNMQGETTISGGNGLGKSRHFDAFLWLLFGKDTLDRKDYDVKTMVDGKPLPKVSAEVCGTLLVDGAPLQLRRVFKEEWVKPRGQIDEVFKGHKTELFWNDVPLSVTEYQNRVAELIDGSVFKMITNPLFFVGMGWQEQREHLFRMAGTVSDGEVAAKNPELAALLGRISGTPLKEFRRRVAAEKRRLKEELSQVQPRIDQTAKLMPEEADFSALEAEATALRAALAKVNADIDGAVSSASEAERQKGEASRARQAEINTLKSEMQRALHSAQAAEDERAFEANKRRRAVGEDFSEKEAKKSALQRTLAEVAQGMKKAEELYATKAAERDALRDEWNKKNASEYKAADAEALACPAFSVTCTCAEAIAQHEKNRERARDAFMEAKVKELDFISAKGAALNDQISALNDNVVEYARRQAALKADIAAAEKEAAMLQEELSEVPPMVAGKKLTAADVPACSALAAKVKELEAADGEATGATDNDVAAGLRARRNDLANRLSTVRLALNDRVLIAKYREEMADLAAHGKLLAQQIADAERDEFLVQQLTRAKITECEKRVNDLFTLVTFQLFDKTIDGDVFECCKAIVGGVPFGVANTAAQVNAGLDVINALCKFYGVSAPIFIDRRESVNAIIPVESQVINLVVSSDKELIIS